MFGIEVVNGKIDGFVDGWYIGRGGKGKMGSALANPYRIGENGNRKEVIEKYRKWLWEKIKRKDEEVMNELKEIWRKSKKGKLKLVCFCKPLACHGDVIIRAVDWIEESGYFESFE